MKIDDNELLRQFETKVDDYFLVLEYSSQERKMFLTKLNTNGCEDTEIIDEFIRKVFKIAAENKKKIVPTHIDIIQFMKKYPEYQEQLATGIKI